LSDDIGELGPAMLALSEKQRKYVWAMLNNPLGNPTVWCRAAGYSDKGEACKVRAFYVARNPKIMEAAQEECRKHLNTMGGVLGVGVMMQIARKKGHKQQLAAATALANRSGFHETTEHKVTVEHIDDTRMLEFANRLASELGVDRGKLIGFNAKVIEGKAE
jgi:hypothetical protein